MNVIVSFQNILVDINQKQMVDSINSKNNVLKKTNYMKKLVSQAYKNKLFYSGFGDMMC